MRERLSRTLSLVAIAAVVVSALSFFTLRHASRDLSVACRGELVVESLGPARGDEGAPWTPDYRVEGPESALRVVIARDGAPGCSDLAVPMDRAPKGHEAWRYDVRRLGGSRAAVVDAYGNTVVRFRAIDREGRRFSAERVLRVAQLPSLVSLIGLGVLAIALARARRAASYANRLHAWTEARLRPDGLLESESGAALATVDRAARVPAGPVLVDGRALEGHDVYRGLPVIVRGHIAAGSHARWLEGTMRRMRDARTLAILAMLVAGASLAARLVS